MDNQIPWLILGLVWVINFFISWLNARTVGVMWSETKFIGGWKRFMAWMGAIMSASGFTWCYMIVLLLGAYYLQPIKPDEPPLLDMETVSSGFALGYLLIIPGIIFSGFMIWIDSLVQAWRRRDATSIGITAWNTFAQIHNTYSMMRGLPEVWESVGKLGGKGSGKSKGAILVIILVLLAIISGVLTTWAIINHYAGTRTIERPSQHQFKHRVSAE